MNTSTSKSRLERRLRNHYSRTADELSLDPLSWDDVLSGRGRRSAAAGRVERGRWFVAASVVTLVAGGTVGAVAMRSADDPATSGPVSAPPSTFGEETPPPSVLVADLPDPERPFLPCPEDPSLPADAASTVYPNDVRFNGMPLPESTPTGYCVIDHTAGGGSYGNSNYTVWASCADCAQPTAAVALIRNLALVTDDPSFGDPSQEPGAVSFPTEDGRGGWFVPPSESSAVSTIHMTDAGGSTIRFVGWGLDEDSFVAFAEAATTPGAELPGELAQVYDGPMASYVAGTVPTGYNFHLNYANSTGSESLSYEIFYDGMTWPAETRLPLMALAWVAPDPVLSESGDERTIAFGPAAARYGGQQTIVVTSTPNSVTTWVSIGVSPVSVDELAALPLTPAAPDDPRWIEIAYESGQYNAVG